MGEYVLKAAATSQRDRDLAVLAGWRPAVKATAVDGSISTALLGEAVGRPAKDLDLAEIDAVRGKGVLDRTLAPMVLGVRGVGRKN